MKRKELRLRLGIEVLYSAKRHVSDITAFTILSMLIRELTDEYCACLARQRMTRAAQQIRESDDPRWWRSEYDSAKADYIEALESMAARNACPVCDGLVDRASGQCFSCDRG